MSGDEPEPQDPRSGAGRWRRRGERTARPVPRDHTQEERTMTDPNTRPAPGGNAAVRTLVLLAWLPAVLLAGWFLVALLAEAFGGDPVFAGYELRWTGTDVVVARFALLFAV